MDFDCQREKITIHQRFTECSLCATCQALFKALEIGQYTNYCRAGTGISLPRHDNLIGTENTNMRVERNEIERKRTSKGLIVEGLKY